MNKEIERVISVSKARKLARAVCLIKPTLSGPDMGFALTYFPRIGEYIVRNPGDPAGGFALAHEAWDAALNFRQSCLDYIEKHGKPEDE